MPFEKGKSGNPRGRPKGSRHKLSEALTAKLASDFEAHGEGVIEKVRTEEPSQYLRVIASIIPKEVDTTVRRVEAKELPDDELADIAAGSGEGAAETQIDPQVLN